MTAGRQASRRSPACRNPSRGPASVHRIWTMIAIEIPRPGGPEVLQPAERPAPRPAPGEVLIAVAAAGVNRPDLMQRQGHYPPPPGVSDIPGLEAAGHIVAIGDDVEV